jgi:8-oxo-dGTP pyrophosphatase MutT (NUDIX family)
MTASPSAASSSAVSSSAVSSSAVSSSAVSSSAVSSSAVSSSAADRAAVAGNVAAFPSVRLPGAGLKPASVALCVVCQEDDVPCLLITRRAPTLRSHAGQWALPGGRRDEGESVAEAARRELLEETGVAVGAADVLGVLDDFATRSGYLITPVVVWGGPVSAQMRRNASEVARIYVIPVADFDVPPRLLRIPESEQPVLQLPLLGNWVNAPTAAIIYQFCQVGMHGLVTRVAHYEQPVFAWK